MVALLFTAVIYAQKENPPKTCISDQTLERVLKDNPDIKSKMDEMDYEMSKTRNSNVGRSIQTIPSQSYTIPVVVYVVYDPANPASNISDAQVNSQLTALNTYFSSSNIKFCLATKSGTQTISGINHINNANASNHNSATEQSMLQSLASYSITKDKYLRIWVVNTIDGANSPVQGYAMFPNAPSFDGIVMKYDVFGDVNDISCACSLKPNYDTGTILAHEVGHYLGLFHTFEGGCTGMDEANCATAGDRVCDTPPVLSPNYGCVSNINTCHESYPSDLPDNINNFMDYGNGYCINQFTQGQKERMYYMLNNYRNGLFTIDNQIYTGTCGSENLISAKFSVDKYMVCTTATAVVFSPLLSAGTFTWDFGDGTPVFTTTSTAPFSHNYPVTANTLYTARLTVTNAGQTATSTNDIYVSTCTPVNNSDSYWYLSESSALSFSSGLATFDSAFPETQGVGTGSYPCAIQNSATGSVLFYTDKKSVWDKFHVLKNPSTPLMTSPYYLNGNDSVLIVPQPGNTGVNDKYYVFTNRYEPYESVADAGFRYNIVNVNGTTVTMGATNLITSGSGTGYITGDTGALIGGHGITAIKSCNGYWVITTVIKSGQFYLIVYSLTSSGLVFKSESTFYGLACPGVEAGCPSGFYLYSGNFNIQAAPNGNKVAVTAYGRTSLLDFDKIAGKFLDEPVNLYIGSEASSQTAPSFSPDSKLLYVPGSTAIHQYNLNSGNIDATRTIIGNLQSTVANQTFGDIQQGPDRKLYIAINNSKELAVINNPNALANALVPNAAAFLRHGPVKNFGSVNIHSGLPNMIDAKNETAYDAADKISVYLTACSQYKFFPNVCGSSFKWNFGDPTSSTNTSVINDPTHLFVTSGNHTVSLYTNAGVFIASVIVNVPVVPVVEIVGSSSACVEGSNMTNNSVVLTDGQTITWSITGGAGVMSGSGSNVDVTWTVLPGILTAYVRNTTGCVSIANKTITSLCKCDCLSASYFTATARGQSVRFKGYTPANENQACGNVFAIYYWNFGDGTTAVGSPTHVYSFPGTYTVTMQARILGEYDQILCSYTYTQTVTVSSLVPIGPIGFKESQYVDLSTIKVYPNPASTQLNVNLEVLNPGKVNIAVTSVDGKNLGSYSWNLKKGEQKLELKLPSNLADGIILLQINSDDFSEVRKIIIEK